MDKKDDLIFELDERLSKQLGADLEFLLYDQLRDQLWELWDQLLVELKWHLWCQLKD